MTISSVPSSPGFLSLDAFTQAAQTGREVYADIGGERARVLATGSLPNGRGVAWIDPDADTASMFVDTLARSFGSGIGSAIARELDLVSAPGKPLSSRTVTLAVDMARQAEQVLGGVDFATQLAFSAKASGVGFQQVLNELNIPASTVDASQRDRIDQAMQQRFEHAAQTGQSPVSDSTAHAWLREVLAK